MKRTNIIELGVASVTTQGPGLQPGDEVIGLEQAGLSDD
ncbi:benenodin family lasso peptide [Sphingomonas sp.]